MRLPPCHKLHRDRQAEPVRFWTKGKQMSDSKQAHVSVAKALGIAALAGVMACSVTACGGKGKSGGDSGTSGETKINKDNVDKSIVGKYTYDGESHDITAKEVIDSSGMSTSDDGDNYDIPSADSVLAYARTQILKKAAEDKGVKVTDDDIKAYAEKILGSSDYKTVAGQYGMTEDNLKQSLSDSALQEKLYNEIVGQQPEAPQEPTKPAEGQEQTKTKEYADYIIKLAGDEWDAKGNKWARQDGPYFAALEGQEFDSNGATYDQAETAYYQAYGDWASKSTDTNKKWSDFSGELYAKASIEIYNLAE